MIKELGRSGKTVFVSSHLLGEVEQISDDVGIVKEGRLLTEGPVADLLRTGAALELRTTDDAAAAGVLEGLDGVAGVRREDNRLVVEAPRERAAELSRALAERQIYLSELRPRESSLEEFFLEVTREPAADS
ncbi:MAG: ABC transporter ATP-binding protein, partial [Dehalococcoidia bacterium]|nr:ABC transporter ATP-binding protein [Dehalococcoidia bacterium]